MGTNATRPRHAVSPSAPRAIYLTSIHSHPHPVFSVDQRDHQERLLCCRHRGRECPVRRPRKLAPFYDRGVGNRLIFDYGVIAGGESERQLPKRSSTLAVCHSGLVWYWHKHAHKYTHEHTKNVHELCTVNTHTHTQHTRRTNQLVTF